MFALVISRRSFFYCRYIRTHTGVTCVTVTTSLVYGMSYVIFQRESRREGKRRENIFNNKNNARFYVFVCLFVCGNIVMRILTSSLSLF